MKIYDIAAQSGGWIAMVDGVEQDAFPTWFLAIAATRKRVDHDRSRGVPARIRSQGVDGEWQDVDAGAVSRTGEILNFPVGRAKDEGQPHRQKHSG
jgi:hypothetical protein